MIPYIAHEKAQELYSVILPKRRTVMPANFDATNRKTTAMKPSIALLLILVFLGGITSAETKTLPVKKPVTKAFKSGESLKYLLYYGWVKGGEATMTVQEKVHGNKKVYHAQARAYTIGMASKLYSVNDVYESYFDMKTCLPVRSVRSIAENSYRHYNEVEFNHAENTIVSLMSGKKSVPENIFDVVSAFYYARNELFGTLKVGDTVKFVTYFEDGPYPIAVRFRGYENLTTKAGKFKAMKFSPIVEVGRIFDTPDDMTFWVSDDENTIPLRIQFELMIGSLKCDLVDYEGLVHKIAKIK